MIQKKTLEAIYNEAIKYLLSYRIAEGLELLTALMLECADQQLARKTNQLYDDYTQMLRFLAQGGQDSLHTAIQTNIVRETLSTLQAAHRLIRIHHRLDMYGQTRQTLHAHLGTSCMQLLREQWEKYHDTPMRYEATDAIFDYLWTSEAFTSSEAEEWIDFITRQDTFFQRQLLAGINLSLAEYLDTQKLRVLKAFITSDNRQLRALAVTGSVFCHIRYQQWGVFFPMEQLPTEVSQDVNFLQKYLLKYTRSEAAFQRLGDPSLALQKRLLLEREEPQDMSDLVADPEMKKVFRQTQYFTLLGYDINAKNFSFMSHHEFFNRIAHWLAPFETNRPEVIAAVSDSKGDPKKLARLFLNGNSHCESDKYALCLFLANTTSDKVERELDERFPDMDIVIEPSLETVYSNLLQVYYRFHEFSPWKEEFVSPFHQNIHLPDYPTLLPCFQKPEDMTILCKALIWEESYNRALIYLDNLMHQVGASSSILLLKGLCHQSQQNYKAALKSYRDAEILDPDSTLLLHLMQLCYQQLQDYAHQEELLVRLQSLDKTNLIDADYPTLLATCYTQQGKYEQALQLYYQMEYKGVHLLHALRSIMRCSLLLHKLENGQKYYQKIVDTYPDKAGWQDYLYGGHIAWLLSDWQQAKELYRKYLTAYRQNHPQDNSAGMAAFDTDRTELLQQGITLQDFYLMRDLILSHDAR